LGGEALGADGARIPRVARGFERLLAPHLLRGPPASGTRLELAARALRLQRFHGFDQGRQAGLRVADDREIAAVVAPEALIVRAPEQLAAAECDQLRVRLRDARRRALD